MDASRIFIRGLPPSLTEEQFKKHFATICPITDWNLMAQRRIGYIGYRTHTDALKAIKYFNKSFVRMSRVDVELARSFEEQQFQQPLKHTFIPPTQNAINSPGAVDLTLPFKQGDPRGHAEVNATKADPKLQRFLDSYSRKGKSWANDDVETPAVVPTAIQKDVHPKEGDQSDENYEPVPKKRKKSKKSRYSEQVAAELLEAMEINNKAGVASPTIPKAALQLSDEVSETTPAPAANTSDADWMHSRTSRLLGLVDEEDALNSGRPREGGESNARAEATETQEMSDASSETEEEAVEDKAKPATEEAQDIAVFQAESTGRLFLRNLCYTASEDEIRSYFGPYGAIEEVHRPTDSKTGSGKGFAYVQFLEHSDADKALSDLDGRPFQGRLLHVMPASGKKDHTLDEFAISKLPLKKQKQIRRKVEAASSTFNWNSMYMNSDAVMSSVSEKLGVPKSELMDPTSSDAAVKQAHAETHVIQETKAYFVAQGVDLEAFKKRERVDTTILVKNFSYGTSAEELRKLFETYGSVSRLLMPPSGTIAVVEFKDAPEARAAFGTLAYRKFKDSILFLEKAPRDLFRKHDMKPVSTVAHTGSKAKPSTIDLLEEPHAGELSDTSTLFVRNLNFSTTTDRLREVFQPLDGFLSARVKTKTDAKKPGQVLSMGFGFLEFRSKKQAQAAVGAMNGYSLDGHELLIKASHKVLDSAEQRRNEDQAKKVAGRKTKIIIKNLPFEASKKDIRSLFGSYGQLRSVRVPKKFDSSTRGFAFADFVTAREAENAMDALKDTHLLGRRLVLQFASEDAIDPEVEIEKMQKKVGRQTNNVTVQNLTGTGRKKFTVGREDDFDE